MLLAETAGLTIRRIIRKLIRLALLPKRYNERRYMRRLTIRLAAEPPVELPANVEAGPRALPPALSAPAPRNYEDIIERVYRAILRPGCTAIDIGANVGRHTLGLADSIYPDGCVIAFEPLPECRTQLERLFQEKKSHRLLRMHIALSPLALSNQPGTAEFVHAVDVPGWSGLKQRVYDGPTRLERITVRVETLDRLLGDLKRCEFIKIDAEGGEYDALRGGEQLLWRCRPVVAFEFGANSCTAYGVKTSDMAQFWERLNYRLVDANGKLLTVSEFAQSAIDQHVWDYFALPNERGNLIALVRQCCRER